MLSAVPPEVIGNELILEMNKTAVKDKNSCKWAITLRCGAFLEPGHPVLYPVVKVGFPGQKFDRNLKEFSFSVRKRNFFLFF